MKVLQVVEQGFRTLVEEQDDTILWLTRSMLGAGAQLSVLLSGHAAYYAVQQRRQPKLALGDWQQSQPAEVIRDLDALTAQGVAVYVVREDLAERGLTNLAVRNGIEVIDRSALPGVYDAADQVWQW
ncbi:MAG: DsrE family protein [Spongiibacteraceae bacterium]|jgi:sulfur relay (sulfurtransferase) DsrF/TusC family protein|nr:DsrE family protein [Spongiibacteraceae bacterium]